jgi:proline iminopeptidase
MGAGRVTAENVQAIAPFSYGRWDAVARAHKAAEDEQANPEVMAAFGADGAFAPDATRGALARFTRPVLLLAGQVDPGAPAPAVAEFTGLFPNAELVVQPGAGHFPWLDDADRFVTTVAPFLARTSAPGGSAPGAAASRSAAVDASSQDRLCAQ